jgi:hypothetical protein
MRAIALTAALCGTFLSAPAMAQTLHSTGALGARIDGGVANGLNDSPLKSSAAPEAQLLASTDEKVASISWTFRTDGDRPESPDSKGRWSLSYWDFKLTAQTSLDKENDNTNLLTLDGFPGGTEVKFGVTWFGGTFSEANSDDEKREIALARKKCVEEAAPRNLSLAELTVLCDVDAGGHRGSVSSFLDRYNRAGLKLLQKQWFPEGYFPFAGGEVKANQDSYNYLDRAAFATVKESKFGYGATVFGGVVSSSSLTSLMASFTYSKRYDAQKPVMICQPITPAPQTQCITAPDGAPDRVTHAIFSAEVRHAFAIPVGDHARFAVAPKASFDTKDKSYSVDVPFYFAGDGTGKLRGGIRASYVNQKDPAGGRKDDVTLALFVGVPFTIFR